MKGLQIRSAQIYQQRKSPEQMNSMVFQQDFLGRGKFSRRILQKVAQSKLDGSINRVL